VKEVWAGLNDRLLWLLGRTRLRHLSRRSRYAVIICGALGFLLAIALAATWDGILRTGLDPQTPFQTYRPPAAPEYSQAAAWALNPVTDGRRLTTGPVDVFFVHPTTFAGGRNWNGPLDDREPNRRLEQTMLPNYAGPFARVGRVFAPRYRQASLYAYQLTLREDARDARRFAYGDVRNAFRVYLARYNFGRPFILVGVEQGASIADRLLREEIAPNPNLVSKLAAAYLTGAAIPAAPYSSDKLLPACTRRAEAHCMVGWVSSDEADPNGARRLLSRALVWTPDGQLDNLKNAPVLCVNPLAGLATNAAVSAKFNIGAANASELEWGARAAFLPRQVAAQCVDGVLRVSRPRSASLRPATGFPEKYMAAPYNPFFADIEADAMKRVATFYGRSDMPPGAPPIELSAPVEAAPIHRID
jgi:hypothetical protein